MAGLGVSVWCHNAGDTDVCRSDQTISQVLIKKLKAQHNLATSRSQTSKPNAKHSRHGLRHSTTNTPGGRILPLE